MRQADGRRVWRILAVTGGLLALSMPSRLAADEAKLLAYGRHLASECTSCHRIDGTDNGIPSITGWPMRNFVETMDFYKAGARPNPVMVSVAQSLDEAQMKALASYFGSLPKPGRAR